MHVNEATWGGGGAFCPVQGRACEQHQSCISSSLVTIVSLKSQRVVEVAHVFVFGHVSACVELCVCVFG